MDELTKYLISRWRSELAGILDSSPVKKEDKIKVIEEFIAMLEARQQEENINGRR